MKPSPFEYLQPRSVEEATTALAAAGGDARILAGGQSLMPMINFRLVKPAILVDINAIPDLGSISAEGSRIHLGASVRHRMVALNQIIREKAPIVHEAVQHVAHLTVRNRGTFCGSVCHADPATEMPLMTLLLDGEIEARSSQGKRFIPAAEFFEGSLVNALRPDELVTSISIESLPPNIGWGFQEFAKRHGDFAIACVATVLRFQDGVAADVRFGMMGVGETPLRLPVVEDMIEGREISPELLDQVAVLLSDILVPNTDLHASASYRRHLSGTLARRALSDAWHRASTAEMHV